MTEKLKVRNPRSGEFDYEIDVTDAATIQDIAAELRAAQRAWQGRGIEARIAVLQDWRAAIESSSDEIFAALSTDTGRRKLARGEIGGVIGMIDNWCRQAPALMACDERPSAMLPDVGLRPQLSPYPLLGVISPWNFPLLLSFIDAIPALLAGCAVNIKPSEVTPRFAAAMTECIEARTRTAQRAAIRVRRRTHWRGIDSGRGHRCLYRQRRNRPQGGCRGGRPFHSGIPRTRRQGPGRDPAGCGPGARLDRNTACVGRRKPARPASRSNESTCMPMSTTSLSQLLASESAQHAA